jgi:diaminopimelate decarboxylase
VDNFHELALLQAVAKEANAVQSVLLRLSPGIDPHTHQHTTTGVIDSKFGFPIATGLRQAQATGQAEEALKVALSSANLRLVGLHVHLGSPIFELEPYKQAVEVVLRFAAEMAARHGFQMAEFSPGGGFAVQYVRDTPAPPTAAYAEAICSTLLIESRRLGLPPPRLIVEPGRAIVAHAGVALYRVGASKDIPGVRRYVSVDGGMADNIRPALYGARYEAVVANKAGEGGGEPVTIAGKFCESGDILIKDVRLPRLEPGDLIAVPVSGAYCPSMASNYNASLKPAIVMVKEGQARLVRRRETYQDLVEHDLI